MKIHKVLNPFLIFFRKKRMKKFENLFKINNNTKIIDVGGSDFNWGLIKSKPQILLINLDESYSTSRCNNIKFEIGDGTNLKYKDNSIYNAYFNSVIEHLGTFENQRKFAKEINRVGVKIYVQTPAKEFFIEPHLITPFIHWLPQKLQRKLMRNFTIWGIITRPTQKYIDDFLIERRLLTYKEMKMLFPDCKIYKEKFLGFTKSYIAIKI